MFLNFAFQNCLHWEALKVVSLSLVDLKFTYLAKILTRVFLLASLG